MTMSVASKTPARITGTFLDEITHDIPTQNWGPADWARDFDAMKAIGIDTLWLCWRLLRNLENDA